MEAMAQAESNFLLVSMSRWKLSLAATVSDLVELECHLPSAVNRDSE
jgi:hypothetical protein